ncbi:RAMP superfamily CRISPR-associated protein [Laspinema olomoucense]|uniref:RAMP superfamily CRISPR-associated protein n=1 Tax=Laspinema olomoucense TaxID=3231600 RepID=UPI0021BAE292|nr:RAMP superfamily CRISPR-associated protein [Laspinema sp. D3d]MCT7971065.1 RAMP superfamily CRISPR-associated protein [Laspinema sp. D3d]
MTNQFEITEPKPYEFVPFSKERPPLQRPIGHDKYHADRISGTLFLTLTVQTPVHISTGVVAMGSDVGENRIPLIKLMALNAGKNPVIPGSSLKGVVRSVYEAITNSTLAVVTNRYRNQIPQDRLPCRNKEQLCPASRVFGAMDWQGVVEFSDSQCISAKYGAGFMPSLYRPRPDETRRYFDTRGMAKGRKFYYHTDRPASPGQNKGIPVQQAGTQLTFSTRVQLTNLTPAELGVLFIALGQDSQYPMALKIGGGKPIGMGTMTVAVTELKKPDNLRDRYLSYNPESESMTGKPLQDFLGTAMQQAHNQLIQKQQLEQLHRVLFYPTTRQPPQGIY